MLFEFIYRLGRKFRFLPAAKSLDEKLHLVEFPYNSAELFSGIFLTFIALFLVAVILTPFNSFLGYLVGFLALVVSAAAYVYPSGIFYTRRVIEYREEMLRMVLRVATYISLNTSIEYAMLQAADSARGTLRKQLQDIKASIENKQKTTLGDAYAKYISIWNKISPDFVKSLKLLQTAALSRPEDRKDIINEVLETIILAYHNQGKRFAEELSNKTKSLIAVGVLLPMMSLMLLPLISIFLPHLVSATLLAFIYDVFFPAVLLLMAMQFASNRVQVSTVHLEDAPSYSRTPLHMYVLPVVIFLLFSIPAYFQLSTVNLATVETASREYEFRSIVLVWLSLLGFALGTLLFTKSYVNRNKKLWQDVYDIEQDLPHLLQIFSSYLAQNRSIEVIMSDMEDDYKTHGLYDHPVVKIFADIKESLLLTKQSIYDLAHKSLNKLCPSRRVSDMLEQIISFTNIDQRSAARAAKMMRDQSVNIQKLDDYIQTLLSETVGLVSVSATMLAPLLATAAIIMSMGIVMSLEFITKQLSSIQQALGGGASAELQLKLVDITQIIPPTVVELIVGIYFLEMVAILSVFMSSVRIGTDKLKAAETTYSNMLVSFLIFSILLFAGFFAFREIIFSSILRGV